MILAFSNCVYGVRYLGRNSPSVKSVALKSKMESEPHPYAVLKNPQFFYVNRKLFDKKKERKYDYE